MLGSSSRVAKEYLRNSLGVAQETNSRVVQDKYSACNNDKSRL